jgi:hypothetical protein
MNQPTISTPGTPNNQAMPYFMAYLLAPDRHALIWAIRMPKLGQTKARHFRRPG